MIKLNDYLYNGDTVLKIILRYQKDLENASKETGNEIDQIHSDFLKQIMELLQHNEFLTSQSQRIHEFYKFMANKYPFLAFSFRGRIKSLIRSEEKFNGYIVQYIYEYCKEYGEYPPISKLKEKLLCFRDLIAYRIVISLPKCHLEEGKDCEEEELKYLYQIANELPDFLKGWGFSPELSTMVEQRKSPLLSEKVKPLYRDYITEPTVEGYRSLHITFYDKMANCYVEFQLRTKQMDDYAEIGPANHLGYEKKQESERGRRDTIPEGEDIYFDEAYERVMSLQQIELSKVDVNMFRAINNSLINDGCGLYRGRQILPYEHLSRFQNDFID